MKIKRSTLVAFIYAGNILCVLNGNAQSAGSLELLNNTKKYDGQTVVYKGEIIGDIMVRGDYTWLHVNDGGAAIGVWVPNALIKDIRYAGDYHTRGDIVKVSGIFYRSCLEHGGDLDIHASAVGKITSGNSIHHSTDKEKLRTAIFSSMVMLLFYILKEYPKPKKNN